MTRPLTSRGPFLPRLAARCSSASVSVWRLQRLQAPDVVRADADAVADALTQLVLGHEQVPEHPLLDRAVALGEAADQVGHQLVLLPLLRQQVALAGLRVVVGARDPLAGEPAGDLRALLVVRRVLRLTQAAE